MVSISHVMIIARNLYESADQLRKETGLGFYDGGWFRMGLANKIFPLGGGTYLELTAVVDPKAPEAARSPFENAIATGDRLVGVCLRVDTMEELEEVAKRHNSPIMPPRPENERVRSSGPALVASSAPLPTMSLLKGLPYWTYFADMTIHPSGQPPLPAPGLVDPLGVAWLEWGGTEAQMTEWLGFPASRLPFKFNGGPLGLYAFGVKTAQGEIVIRHKPYDQA